MKAAIRVWRRPANVSFALLVFMVMAVFYSWSSQVLTFAPAGISVVIEPDFMIAAIVMAALVALVLPLLVEAVRRAASAPGEAGGTVVGALLGTASMTCCAPVVLPALLSLAGFSGTSILGINSVLARYWLPLAIAGILLLSYTLVSLVQNLELVCELPPVSGNRGFATTTPGGDDG